MHLLDNFKVDIKTLTDIQSRLAKLVDVPTIIVDPKGNPVSEISNFTPFCKLIRSSPKGSKKCIACDAEAGLIAVEKKTPRTYTCHAGLIDCVSPIIVNGHFLGSVLGGQVLIDGEQTRDAIDIKGISKKFEIPIDLLEKSLEFIPVVSREYLQNYVDFYNFLANQIAQMGIHRLTQEKLLKESREKLQLEQQAKKMELKTIRAQIHPHFLFNTLNTIARMALIEDAPKTEELIYQLSNLLRYNLKNVEDLPRIRDEITNIKRYLSIQTFRYSDRISYEIDIDESIMEYRIPSMILQPIVENSMIHGLEPKKEGGKITITGKFLSDKDLLIKVSDDGRGIGPKLLHTLNSLSDMPNDHAGIGIKNTSDRIRHHFGKSYSIKIESELDSFTTVYIHIPRIR
ncbi:sensor histidine kinase [Clostridium formicaceticum]|uniref:Histidine kinase n=1 Tax=Clostridium formicaceticum TaxID=1497 RepID=A0AAC9RLA5_9CLOT|nr:PocR ligand-binding domain-containing protein [Clostridium formicaceticum]AOY77132.1 histidine kinase [Clostridium formicaceticum]ARE87647.1 Sensor histidine kinase YpdA [Clostridium formicaceticum]